MLYVTEIFFDNESRLDEKIDIHKCAKFKKIMHKFKQIGPKWEIFEISRLALYLKKVYFKPIGMILLKFIIKSGKIYKTIIFLNTATVDTASNIFSLLVVFREYSTYPVFLSYNSNHLLDMEF